MAREDQLEEKVEEDFQKIELKNEEKIIKNKLSERTIFATVLILIVIPITIAFGVFVLNDRKYYFIVC